MITAQDIRERTFEKSKLGGYDMAEVDEFLEQIADDLTSAQKETAVLKSKMKVLVDKIEEYRSNENALNQTLLSAQKLATQIEAEAKERAAKMISDADKEVHDKIGAITEQTAIEEKRLASAKAVTSKFLEGMRAMCNAQLKNIESISSEVGIRNEPAPAAAPAPVAEAPVKAAPKAPAAEYEARFARETADIEEAVRSIEASVAKRQPEPTPKMDLYADLNAVFSGEGDGDSTQPFKI